MGFAKMVCKAWAFGRSFSRDKSDFDYFIYDMRKQYPSHVTYMTVMRDLPFFKKTVEASQTFRKQGTPPTDAELSDFEIELSDGFTFVMLNRIFSNRRQEFESCVAEAYKKAKKKMTNEFMRHYLIETTEQSNLFFKEPKSSRMQKGQGLKFLIQDEIFELSNQVNILSEDVTPEELKIKASEWMNLQEKIRLKIKLNFGLDIKGFDITGLLLPSQFWNNWNNRPDGVNDADFTDTSKKIISFTNIT